MEWISVKDRLPPAPIDRITESYLVLIQRKGYRKKVAIAKWEKKMHRKPLPNETVHQILKESPLARWRISGIKGSDVTHWMPFPSIPEETNEMD